jgi:hypothetical protein
LIRWDSHSRRIGRRERQRRVFFRKKTAFVGEFVIEDTEERLGKIRSFAPVSLAPIFMCSSPLPAETPETRSGRPVRCRERAYGAPGRMTRKTSH